MKQQIIRDNNFNEIEYIELDSQGNITYTMYTHYYYDNDKQCFSDKVYEKIDSNGWSRQYDRNGKLKREINIGGMVGVSRMEINYEPILLRDYINLIPPDLDIERVIPILI